ncbi:MAG: hypothetical protein CVU61_06630 [Deltaproteobacteria bacterium HGW-Deltaproteobacteria-19]|jgi:GT2 family glycosyltransferase|nr:MAG: hypothetical protein CVU61_06630 [Deltaproteobacteria bacterium HGW-Deltaproteobacteria-19]
MIPDVTYLILNYNPRGEETAQGILGETIRSFHERKSPRLKAEVYLLDQGTTGGHRRWLREQEARFGFSLILLEENIGISGAINRLVRMARSPVVALITSDVIVTTGMDEDLFEKVQIPEVFQALPFTDKSDVPRHCWIPAEPFGSDGLDLAPLQETELSLMGRLAGRKRRGYLRCIGVELNAMFWRRSVFDEVGFFDERWKACYENNDFSLRCFLAGGCTAVSYDSFVWHHHKVTEKNDSRKLVFACYGEDGTAVMKALWDEKWPDLNRHLDIYRTLGERTIRDFPEITSRYGHSRYLPDPLEKGRSDPGGKI